MRHSDRNSARQADASDTDRRPAIYVATLSADLAAMARQHGLDTLGYLLEMVRLEAESDARQARARQRTLIISR